VITEITKIGINRFMILIYDKIKWVKKRGQLEYYIMK
jgi:hypothetical protein